MYLDNNSPIDEILYCSILKLGDGYALSDNALFLLSMMLSLTWRVCLQRP